MVKVLQSSCHVFDMRDLGGITANPGSVTIRVALSGFPDIRPSQA